MRPLALALALSFAACKANDPKDPQTWIKHLDDADPRARIKAVQELRKLKARTAAPPVAELLKDPLLKEDAAVALGDIGGPDEVQPLLDAVDTTVGAGSLPVVLLCTALHRLLGSSVRCVRLLVSAAGRPNASLAAMRGTLAPI